MNNLNFHNSKLKSRYNAFFSLIELLIMISILAILVSLLNPALRNSLDHSKIITCQKQLQSISAWSSYYIDDHDSRFPYAGLTAALRGRPTGFNNHEKYGITWDDLLGDYDGRELSLTQKKAGAIFISPKRKSNSQGELTVGMSITKIYACPEDNISRTSSGPDNRLPRSYSINSHDAQGDSFKPEEHYSRKGISVGINSVYTSEVDDHKNTIYIAPKPIKLNELGRGYNPDIRQPESARASIKRPGLHKDLSFNFLFTDGHIENLILEETTDSTSSYTSADGMWSRKSDPIP